MGHVMDVVFCVTEEKGLVPYLELSLTCGEHGPPLCRCLLRSRLCVSFPLWGKFAVFQCLSGHLWIRLHSWLRRVFILDYIAALCAPPMRCNFGAPSLFSSSFSFSDGSVFPFPVGPCASHWGAHISRSVFANFPFSFLSLFLLFFFSFLVCGYISLRSLVYFLRRAGKNGRWQS